MRLNGSVYCLFEGASQYGLRLPQAPDARFHAVRDGACWLRVEDDEPIRVSAGELILVPGGERHDVLADDASDVVGVEEVFGDADPFQKIFRLGKGAPTATLICGGLGLEDVVRHPLRDGLPRVLRLRLDEHDSLLAGVLDMAESELRSSNLAANVVLGRLSEIIFVAAIRSHAASLPGDSRGWLAAMRDQAVGTALAAIHREPEAAWRVERLARQAGVSTTTLNTRFRRLLGESPSRYVLRWRILLAADLLRHSELGVKQIADRVGYGSESAFSRAFHRETNRWPTEYREAAAQSVSHASGSE